MTLSAATVTLGPGGPTLAAAAPLPVEALVLGKPAAEAAELLPRLFSLCRAAQGMAARLALGLPAGEDPRAEILRDHLLALCVTLPRAFGLAPRPIPADAASLLGPGGLPDRPAALIEADPLAACIAQTFPPGAALCAALPRPPDPLAEGAFENSPAGRQADHPLMRAIEAGHGRGPLWRYAGRLVDLEAALSGRLPAARLADGVAIVPAARGAYALRLTVAGGIVTGLARRTPTDHLLASGGALLQALAGLPGALRALAPQIVTLHDPCIPVTIREVQDA
jgi:hypothetical protein